METHYDTIVIGARTAGATTAMLLAQAGQRVLVIDKAKYGSDTLSSHALMPGAVNSLHRWGLLDAVFAADTPMITETRFVYGGENMTIEVKPRPGVPGLAAPRRTVLDPILVDAAIDAGATVRHETSLLDLVTAADGRVCGAVMELPDGAVQTVRADLVIGADGLRSKVARIVKPAVTHQGTETSAYIMKYFHDLSVERNAYVWSYDLDCGSGVIPTTAGGTCVFAAMPTGEFRAEARSDIEGAYARILGRLNPEIAAQLPHVRQDGATRSWPGVLGRFHKAFGAGWALVGDAGYFKDPNAAHGISDAFRDAELLAEAATTGDFETYEAVRDIHSAPLFEALERKNSYTWDLAELQQIQYDMAVAMRNEAKALDVHRSASMTSESLLTPVVA